VEAEEYSRVLRGVEELKRADLCILMNVVLYAVCCLLYGMMYDVLFRLVPSKTFGTFSAALETFSGMRLFSLFSLHVLWFLIICCTTKITQGTKRNIITSWMAKPARTHYVLGTSTKNDIDMLFVSRHKITKC